MANFLTSILFLAYWLPIPSLAKGLWSSSPAEYSDIIRQAYPVGNGQLGALPFGIPGAEKVNLNIDSLWSGGPFENPSYSGGNPASGKDGYLSGIRDWIFENGTGNVSALYDDGINYGSYAVAANLSVAFDLTGSPIDYNRSLDLESGLHSTVFKSDNSTITSTVFCSYPDNVCVYQLSSSNSLPAIGISLENQLLDSSLVTTSCTKSDQSVRLRSVTQASIGMKADVIARVVSNSNTASCNGNSTNLARGSLSIPATAGSQSVTVVIGGGTDYDSTKGNAANNFSFRGEDPAAYVLRVTAAATSKQPSSLLSAHVEDYQQLANTFALALPDTVGSAGLETSEVLANYQNGSGDPYLESLMQSYARHLFISSSRPGSLPPNLQGRWSSGLYAAWSGDYHANINLQMNHWGVSETGLGAIQSPLWSYMTETWVPRGELTAQLLYGAPKSAYVTHDEMNIFGHTAMKNDAQWANYPASATWMMSHVYDHYTYSGDISWWTSTGYPLLRGQAVFWLSQLQEDTHFNDGTLVVNPCNSPEHGPTTFGCTHYQQLILELFANILDAAPSTEDSSFLDNVSSALSRLDKGLHIGSWSQIQEWKLDLDAQNDTHRHLSNLYGWYPGYSLIHPSVSDGLRNATIQNAVATTLWSRGPGVGSDADAGWEKVWRSACWARLNETERAYSELRYAISENIADNGLSMYSAHNEPFQIDANFGINGAVMAMLILDLPRTEFVVLGPAIPAAWGVGNVKGVRTRGGGVLDFAWDGEGVVTQAAWTVRPAKERRVLARDGTVLA